MPAFQSRQVYRITLKYPEARPRLGAPSRIAQVGPQGPPAPFASLRAKGAPLRGGSLLWTTWTIRSADVKTAVRRTSANNYGFGVSDIQLSIDVTSIIEGLITDVPEAVALWRKMAPMFAPRVEVSAQLATEINAR